MGTLRAFVEFESLLAAAEECAQEDRQDDEESDAELILRCTDEDVISPSKKRMPEDVHEEGRARKRLSASQGSDLTDDLSSSNGSECSISSARTVIIAPSVTADHFPRARKCAQWTAEDDLKMIELVRKFGPKHWSRIAAHLPGRVGKQCRERFAPANYACAKSERRWFGSKSVTVTTGGTTSSTRVSSRTCGAKMRTGSSWRHMPGSGTAGPRLPSFCPVGPTMRSRTIGTARCDPRTRRKRQLHLLPPLRSR